MWSEVPAVSRQVHYKAIVTVSPLIMSLLLFLPAPQLSCWLLNGQDFLGGGGSRRAEKRWALV